ncbi:MAG: acyl carrier protein [Muribaculaceae bacterium]|nr:acyl carrier protein [Muribaculaceae bacterium]
MELQDFIKNFSSIFEETDPETIKADTVFSQIPEWDSVMMLSLITMIDQEYDLMVDVEELNDAVTVQDLFDYVSSLES